MTDVSSNNESFQIRSKPTKLKIIDPNTGEALQLPSPTRKIAPEPLSLATDTAVPGPILSKHESKSSRSTSKRNALQPGEKKAATLKLPSVAGKNKVSELNHGNRSNAKPSRGLSQQTSSNGGKQTVSTNSLYDYSSNPEGNQIERGPQWKPDIYAHAYVPEAFLAVNASPAILLSSKPVQAIDFVQYTSNFACPLFLPSLPPLQAPTFDGASSVDTIDNLAIENYEQHLSDCLILDLEAQVPEIRTYDMFGVQLGVVDRAQEMYSLHVPGLRENTPRAAFGDNVMVRQLVMDPATKLPLAAPATGSTGYQISAVVVAVDRTNEALNLRINGITPHLLICNVSFIVQTRWVKSLQRSVGSMASELLASQKHCSAPVTEEPTPEDPASSPEHDFGPIGTPIKSPPARSRHDYFGSTATPMKSPSITRGDYFGAIGTPVRTPRQDRQEYFGNMAFPSHGGPGYFQHSGLVGSKPRAPRSSYSNGLEAPLKCKNQAWLRRMLFPEESDGVVQKSLPQGVYKRSWFDRHFDHEQKV